MNRDKLLFKKRKILIITSSLKFGGGAERFISILSKNLISKYSISIITFQDFSIQYSYKGSYYSLKENVNLKSRLFKYFKLIELTRPFRIFKLIHSISPDIIISFMDIANVYTIITKLLFHINIPLICSVRTNPNIAYQNTNRHIHYLIRILYRLRKVNKIVVVSQEIQGILERIFRINKQKLITIYNGIELKKIRKLKENKIIDFKEIFENQNIIKFITVGRLTEAKGYEYLIEAFSKIRTDISNSKLIIIGDGLLKKELKILIKKKHLEDEILLLGLKKNPFKYLANSDIFILSSIYEGFPNVLLEALACGIPVISTNCKTGPKEILSNGEYGILVKVKNSTDLAEKMIFLAKNRELLIHYSKKSYIRANFFDIKKPINEWIILIEKVIENSI